MTFQIEDSVVQSDRVVVRCTMRGTHTGASAGAAPAGKIIHQGAIVIYQPRGGRTIVFWPMVDRLRLALQLGLIAPPGRDRASPHASGA
jgi:predicted ester cyclase